MKISHLFYITAIILFSCEDKTKEEAPDANPVVEENLPLDELAKRQVESQLSIPWTENYILEIHKAHFDGDNIEDAVILVNREQFARKTAIENGKSNQEKVAYTGNYNYLFYYNGATNKVSRPINVGSSPFAPLKIDILNIQSAAFKDFTLDYRILENCYRNFYTVTRGVPRLVFQWPIFELEKEDKKVINYIEYAKGTYTSAKDILIYKGKLDTPVPENLRSDFSYSISKDGEMEYLFFYNPNEGKYFTKN
jgi:hypothetical protein